MHLEKDACFGFCRDCGLVHSLPSSQAVLHCRVLMAQLREQGRLDFEAPVADADPRLTTKSLYSETRGKMFGVLVCEDRSGREVVLRAFSSKFNGVWNIPGWAPPLVDADTYMAAIKAGDAEIHPLTELIATLEPGSRAWNEKILERKAVSHRILPKLQALYEVNNFRGEKRSLAGAFNPGQGMPTGTGDCCAPKLLNQAVRLGWKPVSLAEFFWGRETASGDRIEGEFYASCRDKCLPLLGFMLCGLADRSARETGRIS